MCSSLVPRSCTSTASHSSRWPSLKVNHPSSPSTHVPRTLPKVSHCSADKAMQSVTRVPRDYASLQLLVRYRASFRKLRVTEGVEVSGRLESVLFTITSIINFFFRQLWNKVSHRIDINPPAKGPAPPESILFSVPVGVHTTKKAKNEQQEEERDEQGTSHLAAVRETTWLAAGGCTTRAGGCTRAGEATYTPRPYGRHLLEGVLEFLVTFTPFSQAQAVALETIFARAAYLSLRC